MMTNEEMPVQDLLITLTVIRRNLNPDNFRNLSRDILIDNTDVAIRIIDSVLRQAGEEK